MAYTSKGPIRKSVLGADSTPGLIQDCMCTDRAGGVISDWYLASAGSNVVVSYSKQECSGMRDY